MQVANPDIAIQERAYAIWEEEGRPDGRDWEHWYRAMQEIMAPKPAAAKASAATAATKPAPKSRARKSAKGRLRDALKSALS